MKNLYDKLSRYGTDSLSNRELLALLCGDIETADAALSKFGSFRNLSKENFHSIAYQASIEKDAAVNIDVAMEFARRFNIESRGDTIIMDSPQTAAAYLTPQLRDLKYERFIVLYLNGGKIIESEQVISTGGPNSTIVGVSQVVKQAIVREASSVILAHNHPSGTLKESTADIRLTRKIKDALEMVNILVDDHIIIAGNDFISLRNKGLI